MAMKASCGTFTLPMDFMRFLPSACFFSSFFFLRMSHSEAWPPLSRSANNLQLGAGSSHASMLTATCKLQGAARTAPADISAIALGKNILADGCITGKPVISICHVRLRRHSYKCAVVTQNCSHPHHCNDSACTATAPVICSEATTREPMAAWIGICGRQHPAIKHGLCPTPATLSVASTGCRHLCSISAAAAP